MLKKLATLFLFLLPFSLYLFFLETSFSPKKVLSGEKVENGTLPKFVEKILDQPFEYLGKGHQMVAFISKDQKFVLKLPRKEKLTSRFWRRIPFLDQGDIAAKERRKSFLLRSLEIATEVLKEETGVLYFHSQKTEEKKVSLQTPFRKQTVDLGKACFILQKVFPTFSKECDLEDRKKMEQMIRSFLLLIKARHEKEIIASDASGWGKNLGFLEGKAFQIDIGGFQKNWYRNLQLEMEMSVKEFRSYLNDHAPEYADFLDREIKTLSL